MCTVDLGDAETVIRCTPGSIFDKVLEKHFVGESRREIKGSVVVRWLLRIF